jgi:tRNA1(Val) A37 N6-methylase TrmN6
LILAPFAFAAVGCKNQDLTPTMADTHFKGWAKPGPVPPGAASPLHVPADETLDAIGGHFRLFQLRDGHRFSTDDVLTAWYGTTWVPRTSSILDLGSGIGSVAMIAAWRLPGVRVVTIEAQEESVRLARKSAAYNGLEARYEIREGDFRDQGGSNRLRQGSGGQEGPPLREDERFDLVLGRPPYFRLDAGIHSEHPQKVACRFELRGDIADYCGVAARHLDVGGISRASFQRSSGRASKTQRARPSSRSSAIGPWFSKKAEHR